MGCPIKIGCEEFIFIINIETTLDLGKKSCTFMIFKLDFELRPFWPFWSWNFENAAKCGLAYPNEPIHVKKNLKIQVRKYSAFDLAFLTFVGLFKILLRSLRCKKSGGMQESCTLAFYHQKQFLLKISHFEPVCNTLFQTNMNGEMSCNCWKT